MNYRNGKDIFPESLLKEIQKYASGQLVYIPAGDAKRGWGQTSGYKQYLAQRNETIKSMFRAGAGVEQLADEFYLSLESIKKIVYTKEDCMPEYHCTLSSAREYAALGKLEDWVHAYLLSDGHNEEFSRGLRLYPRRFLGPMKMPFSLFARCCGPEPHMKWRIDGKWFERHVANLQEVITHEEDLPPLIVHYLIPYGETEGVFELNDGNHRLEAYHRLGIAEGEVIVWITEDEEYQQFIQRFATCFSNQ